MPFDRRRLPRLPGSTHRPCCPRDSRRGRRQGCAEVDSAPRPSPRSEGRRDRCTTTPGYRFGIQREGQEGRERHKGTVGGWRCWAREEGLEERQRFGGRERSQYAYWRRAIERKKQREGKGQAERSCCLGWSNGRRRQTSTSPSPPLRPTRLPRLRCFRTNTPAKRSASRPRPTTAPAATSSSSSSSSSRSAAGSRPAASFCPETTPPQPRSTSFTFFPDFSIYLFYSRSPLSASTAASAPTGSRTSTGARQGGRWTTQAGGSGAGSGVERRYGEEESTGRAERWRRRWRGDGRRGR